MTVVLGVNEVIRKDERELLRVLNNFFIIKSK